MEDYKKLKIEYTEELGKELGNKLGAEFTKYAKEKGITTNYKEFSFVAKEDEEVVGIISGNSYYGAVHIQELIVFKGYRGKHIGRQLVEKVEDYYNEYEFKSISVTTHKFLAPNFYEKLGFQLEFIRKNKENSKLDRYFFVKYR